MSKVNVTKSEPIRKPSFIPTPSPFATPSRADVALPSRQDAALPNHKDAALPSRVGGPENKTNIKVKTTTRINRTDIQKNPEPTPKAKIVPSERQATNYIEICIIIIIVFIIYRYCKKPPVKKNPRHNEGLPIHTPPSSPQNRNNQEVYYGFQMQPTGLYRRSNSSNSLT
jgi:hypothetical protein